MQVEESVLVVLKPLENVPMTITSKLFDYVSKFPCVTRSANIITGSRYIQIVGDFVIFVKEQNMKGIINIAYPESLANSLRLSEKEFESEMKTSSLVKLYELGRVSSGVAASVLGISRLDFLDLLAKYKVSVLEGSNSNDLNEDISNA